VSRLGVRSYQGFHSGDDMKYDLQLYHTLRYELQQHVRAKSNTKNKG
jgi:hypothetical protein